MDGTPGYTGPSFGVKLALERECMVQTRAEYPSRSFCTTQSKINAEGINGDTEERSLRDVESSKGRWVAPGIGLFFKGSVGLGEGLRLQL